MSLAFLDETENRMWSSLRGWLLPQAASALNQYALSAPEHGSFVEIGSFSGKSTVCIARALAERKRRGVGSDQFLTAIDVRFQPDFVSNVQKFVDPSAIHRLQAASLDAFNSWHGPIAFLYIDGNHEVGHAIADLLVWDLWLAPGSIVALDDTAGFMLGPNLQVQIAMASRCFEHLGDYGGVTFLRKHKSLLPTSEVPISDPCRFAWIDYITANLGAMDPLFRLPVLKRQTYPPSEVFSRLIHSSLHDLWYAFLPKIFRHVKSRLRATDRSAAQKVAALPQQVEALWSTFQSLAASQTPCAMKSWDENVTYLRSCFEMRRGAFSAALRELQPLSECSDDVQFINYKISIAQMALLRIGNCFDLMGEHQHANEAYLYLHQRLTLPELKAAVEHFMHAPFSFSSGASEMLMREYNQDVAAYKRPAYSAG
jgi:hypothetical protein